MRIRIIVDGPNVIVADDEIGRSLFGMSWNQMLEFNKALAIKIKEAEANAKAEKLIFNEAIALRTGMPFGFSDNPKIKEEARKEAGWNEKLRRWFKSPDQRGSSVGTPRLQDMPTVDGQSIERKIHGGSHSD